MKLWGVVHRSSVYCNKPQSQRISAKRCASPPSLHFSPSLRLLNSSYGLKDVRQTFRVGQFHSWLACSVIPLGGISFNLFPCFPTEFKKTDKSILVSPEGPSRVAFNPEQKPRHGVLKSPTGTPAGELQMKKPFTISAKKRPTAVESF